MKMRVHLIVLATFVLLSGTWVLSKTVFAATTVTVDDDGDTGDATAGDGVCATAGGTCTLRAAIEELNALGVEADPHEIRFDIPGAGPHVIAPSEALPRIRVPVVIDGSTQPGASCPTADQPADLRIILDGSNLTGYNGDGLDLSSAGSGSHGSTIRGLVIGNFISGGITIFSDDNQIECNHVGLGADGVSPVGNGYNGINIYGRNNAIGGAGSEAQRNVIAGNDGFGGVYDSGDGGTVIANNYIGTTADGLNPLGNVSGIYLYSALNSTVGGASPLAANVISGNERYGIHMLGAEDSHVLGNLIGTGRDGVTPVANGWDGIFIYAVTNNNTIGGVATGEGNRIAHNGDSGILVLGQNELYYPENNALRGNEIFDNGDLGIDLGFDGVDENDLLDEDSGPNGRQNYPVLNSASSAGTILGSLESQPNQSYEIDFYVSEACDDSGYGQGEIYLGSANVSTDADGLAAIDVTFGSGALAPGQSVTATATDASGNTSEFSACAFVDGLDPGAAPKWITDCFGATAPPPPPPPPPAGDHLAYLPLVSSGGGTPSGFPPAPQAEASPQTLELVNGGVVTGVDGVSVGAVAGTLTATLNISITHTSAPTQTIIGDPQVHGAYYHIAADENVMSCDQEKGFVLGLPVPDGVPTDTLAIAAISSQAGEWALLTGLYDDVSQLMLVPLSSLTTEGSTVALVENGGFTSQGEPSGTEWPGLETPAIVGPDRISDDAVTFEVVCITDSQACNDGKHILIEFLLLLYIEFEEMGFDHGPRLPFKIERISILERNTGQPSVLVQRDTTAYEVEAYDDVATCESLAPPLGNYHLGPGTAVFCFSPPSPLSSAQMRGIRHAYFEALAFRYYDVLNNYLRLSSLNRADYHRLSLSNELDLLWIIESMASAAEISAPSQMESSNDYIRRPVDVTLREIGLGQEYPKSAQDFWVYRGRDEGSGLPLLREVLESPNAGALEGVLNFFGGQDVLQYAYWYWVRNQVMLEEGILLNDDDVGDPCTYQGHVEELYWHEEWEGTETNAPGNLEKLTTHVIELQMAEYLRPAWVGVRDPKTHDVNPFLHHKVYVDGETGCELVADGGRGFDEPEWDAVVAAGSRVFIVVANVNPYEEQRYEVQVETAPYTP